MRNAPAWLMLERGEECVVDGVSDLDDGAANIFAEAFLVTNLLRKCSGSDEDDRLAQDLYLEDFACLYILR